MIPRGPARQLRGDDGGRPFKPSRPSCVVRPCAAAGIDSALSGQSNGEESACSPTREHPLRPTFAVLIDKIAAQDNAVTRGAPGEVEELHASAPSSTSLSVPEHVDLRCQSPRPGRQPVTNTTEFLVGAFGRVMTVRSIRLDAPVRIEIGHRFGRARRTSGLNHQRSRQCGALHFAPRELAGLEGARGR